MSTFEKIVDRGNRTVNDKRDNLITCADGFTLSVLAGPGAYCQPRPDMTEPADYPGPYHMVEVGYPSSPPGKAWAEYGDEDDEIFTFVPVQLVRDLIASHGGEES